MLNIFFFIIFTYCLLTCYCKSAFLMQSSLSNLMPNVFQYLSIKMWPHQAQLVIINFILQSSGIREPPRKSKIKCKSRSVMVSILYFSLDLTISTNIIQLFTIIMMIMVILLDLSFIILQLFIWTSSVAKVIPLILTQAMCGIMVAMGAKRLILAWMLFETTTS